MRLLIQKSWIIWQYIALLSRIQIPYQILYHLLQLLFSTPSASHPLAGHSRPYLVKPEDFFLCVRHSASSLRQRKPWKQEVLPRHGAGRSTLDGTDQLRNRFAWPAILPPSDWLLCPQYSRRVCDKNLQNFLGFLVQPAGPIEIIKTITFYTLLSLKELLCLQKESYSPSIH
jgi:hypothetical protein